MKVPGQKSLDKLKERKVKNEDLHGTVFDEVQYAGS